MTTAAEPSNTDRFRRECYRCHKAAVVCVCPHVARVNNKTGVVILQHPREEFHAIGTVRFAKLGLENVRVMVEDLQHGAPSTPPPDLPADIGLLYPAPGARLLSDIPPAERPKNLLVLDGTWPQARGCYRRNRWLADLPHFDLAPKKAGQYRIRMEPNERSLSTIEAIVSALEILEPETPQLDALLAGFTQMIDRQIEYANLREGRKRNPRPWRPPFLPELLREGTDRLLLAYGEFALPAEGPRDEIYSLIYWTAKRLATGETFECFVRPKNYSDYLPSARQLSHMGLSRAQIAAGVAIEELNDRFRAFLRPEDIFAVWNKSTIDLFSAEYPLQHPTLCFKEAYCNARKRASGPIASVMAFEGLTPNRAEFCGRAGAIMSQLEPLAYRVSSIRG